MLILSVNSYSQTQRYLEKKGYRETFGAGHGLGMLQLSITNNMVTVVHVETDTITLKTGSYYNILNLSTGRYGSINNMGLFNVVDSSETVKQTKPMEDLSKVLLLYPGFSIRYLDKYIVASSDIKSKTIVLEKSDSGFRVLHEFDFGMAKISRDGKIFYGKNMMEESLHIYSVENWQLLKSVKLPFMPIIYHVLNNGNIIVSELNNGVSILNPKGKRLFKFNSDDHYYEINDSETQLIMVNKMGNIMLWDIATGKLISQDIGTYISKVNSTKKTFLPFKVAGGKYYLIPYGNGIVNLFNTEKGKVVADLFFDRDDWAVIAKDGRVDGTAGAFEKLEWRKYQGNNLISTSTLESTLEKYFSPRLLYSIIHQNVGTNTLPDLSEDIKNTPVLELDNVNSKSVAIADQNVTPYSSKQKNIIITFKVTKNADKVNEVRLYQNKKLVNLQKSNSTSRYTFDVSLSSVFGETNYIYAIATSADGIDSEKTKLMVNYATEALEKPKLYALIIGVNKYQNPKYELNYALPDAEAFKVQLEKNKSALFESIVTKKLYDGEVTKGNIIKAFADLSTVIKEQDMFVFYYAGHGTMSENNSLSEFYIVPNDLTQLYGNEAMLKEKALSAGEIKKLSMGINAQKQIFILDACHSGGALDAVATRGAAEERAIGQLARSTGTFWLTAAGSDQFATEFAQLGHGVFTYSLLEVLQGKDESSMVDGTITIRELSSYIERRVPELSQKHKGKPQYPASFSFGNDFPIMIFNK